MSKTRVTPWQDKDPVPADLLRAMQARRPNGELIGIDRVLLKSVPLATGWNELLSRVRADFSLELIYLELIMLRVAVLNGAQFEWGCTIQPICRQGNRRKGPSAKNAVPKREMFDDQEWMLITLTDQSTINVNVDAAVIASLKNLFGETKTVEAVATVAAYNMVSRFLVALDI